MVPPRREVDLRKGLRPLHESWWWRWNAKSPTVWGGSLRRVGYLCLAQIWACDQIPAPRIRAARVGRIGRPQRLAMQTGRCGCMAAISQRRAGKSAPGKHPSEGGRTRHQRRCYRPIRGVHVRPTCASPLTEEAPHALR